MREGPDISIVAALIGNPASANMLMALLAGPALTATELAQESGLSLSTASGHLAKLAKAGLVVVVRQGRHRYFRLADPDVAIAIADTPAPATITWQATSRWRCWTVLSSGGCWRAAARRCA